MFTINQIQEIHRKLQAMAKKDSQFKSTESIVTEDTYIPLIQNGENRKIFQKDLLDDAYDYIFPDIEKLAEEIKALINSQSDNIIDNIDEVKSEVIEVNNSLSEFKETTTESLSAILDYIGREAEITITSEPGAVIFIDGEETNKKKVLTGTNVLVSIEGPGYDTFQDIITVHNTQTLHIPLKSASIICSLTVTAIPKNAIIRIDGVERSSIQVSKNTKVHVQVEADGYNTYDQMILVTDPEQKLEVTLVKVSERYTDININIPESLDLNNIPQEGKDIQLTATATVILSDKTETTRDVTNIATWNITDTNSQGGSLNKGNGLFTILPNTGRNKDSYEIEVSIDSEVSARLYKRISL